MLILRKNNFFKEIRKIIKICCAHLFHLWSFAFNDSFKFVWLQNRYSVEIWRCNIRNLVRCFYKLHKDILSILRIFIDTEFNVASIISFDDDTIVLSIFVAIWPSFDNNLDILIKPLFFLVIELSFRIAGSRPTIELQMCIIGEGAKLSNMIVGVVSARIFQSTSNVLLGPVCTCFSPKNLLTAIVIRLTR